MHADSNTPLDGTACRPRALMLETNAKSAMLPSHDTPAATARLSQVYIFYADGGKGIRHLRL